MHIYFSAIGGAGIGPLALIAHQAGYQVSGSDSMDSSYIEYLRKHGIKDIYIGQTKENISKSHNKNSIDWFVYSSALTIEDSNPPEIEFCNENEIKTSKRDELLNRIIRDHKYKLIAVAGTHGKSTTTAQIIWLFKQLGIPISYSLGAKIGFADMGEYHPQAEYFIYEADEFDNNFLSFYPYLSVISGVTWDHHEIFPTREIYKNAFKKFINQSDKTIIWDEDQKYLELADSSKLIVESISNIHLDQIKLTGKYNRLDGYLAVRALHEVEREPISNLISIINNFPGLKRRMEKLIDGLYSDYAHTPEKIKGAMSVALEMCKQSHKDLVVIYEPLTDRRQHYILDEYKDCFKGAKSLYWIPSYLAREDPKQTVLKPEELISKLTNPEIARSTERDDNLAEIIKQHLDAGDMVVAMNGGGAGSLDDWLRERFL